MDREPFATYRTYPRGLMADGFVDGKQYAYLSVTQAKHQIPIINDAHEARVKEAVREAVAERDARIAELERALKDTCELMDKCAGRLNVFVAQHAGSRDEYFVFELNRLSVCAGALDAMSRKAIAEIKSVLGKGE